MQESAMKKIKDLEDNDYIAISVTVGRKGEKPKQYGVQWLVPEGIDHMEIIYRDWLAEQCGGIFEKAFEGGKDD